MLSPRRARRRAPRRARRVLGPDSLRTCSRRPACVRRAAPTQLVSTTCYLLLLCMYVRGAWHERASLHLRAASECRAPSGRRPVCVRTADESNASRQAGVDREGRGPLLEPLGMASCRLVGAYELAVPSRNRRAKAAHDAPRRRTVLACGCRAGRLLRGDLGRRRVLEASRSRRCRIARKLNVGIRYDANQ